MSNPLFRKFSRETDPQHHRKFDLPEADKNVHSEVAHPHAHDEDEIIPIVPAQKPWLSSSAYALLMTTLLFLSAAAALWFWKQAGDMRRSRLADQAANQVMLDSLRAVKDGLEHNLDSLQVSWTALSSTNDTLSQQLASATDIIEQKNKTIERIRKENAREEKDLRAQIQQLQDIKSRYETVIAVLNDKNRHLQGTADSLVQQLSDANGHLSAQVKRTQQAEFKGTAFRVEPSRKNDRLTSKAKRTRSITIAFDLLDVPEAYQSSQKMYLSLTDASGMPIPTKNPQYVTLHTPQGEVQIIAQQSQTLQVQRSQSVSFNYDLEEKLKKGVYTAAVYTEKGLLGAASFRLNR